MARPVLEFGPVEGASKEGIRFHLWGDGWEEWFTTLPEAPAGALNDLLVGITYDDQRRPVYRAANLIRFVLNVLAEKEGRWLDAEVDPSDAEPITPDVLAARGYAVPERPPGDQWRLFLVPADDENRFYALVNDKTRLVPVEQLGRCVIGLSEALAGRPTLPSAL